MIINSIFAIIQSGKNFVEPKLLKIIRIKAINKINAEVRYLQL